VISRHATGLATVMLVLISGCAPTLSVTDQTSKTRADQIDFAALQKRIGNGIVRVILRDGTGFSALVGRVSKDSLWYVLPPGVNIESIQVAKVQAFEQKDYLEAGVGGFVLGVFGGGVIGMGIGALAYGSEGGLGIAMAGGLGMITGSVVGTIYGTDQGIAHRYQIPNDTTSQSAKVSP
jgi:hypothetical protein